MRRLFAGAILAALPFAAIPVPAHASTCVDLSVTDACQASCPPGYRGVVVTVGATPITVCENIIP
jgi:hypothetical protein